MMRSKEMKKEQYRIKTCLQNNSIHHIVDKVQVRKWYGWVTVKTFPPYNILDGTVDINEKNDRHYVTICAEELLDMLNEDI